MTTPTATEMTPCPAPDTLDAYLDGDLAPEDAAALDAHAAGCAACGAEVALARRIAESFADEPAVRCPDEVYAAALERMRPGAAPVRALDRPSRAGRRRRLPLWITAAAACAVAVAVIVGAPPLPGLSTGPGVAAGPSGPTGEEGYSPEEIERARLEAEYALALVGAASRDAGALLRDDVLAPRVLGPVFQLPPSD